MHARLLALVTSRAPAATLLIRIMVGAVFMSEGIQKFLYPAAVGAGRFAKIGIPAPELMGPLVGIIEIACGALVLLGLLTRLAALPLIGVMLVAIITTKLPILLGEGFWGFELRKLSEYGFWSMAHEARTDFSMLLGSSFLVLVGAGPHSMDHRIAARSAA
ncbi:MAG: DoxX family protein [Myxococcota bacterium]|nr:DoxX family protein [Myxococcota bacterium]